MATQELDETRAAWDSIAAGYDEFVTPTEVPLATEALNLAGLQRGERFLDVAAGAGGLSLPAARLGARVVATDISPKMIERLLARAREESLDSVEARVMDGHDLQLKDDTFAPVAQWMEQRFPKPCVAGSIPAGGVALRPRPGGSITSSRCHALSGVSFRS